MSELFSEKDRVVICDDADNWLAKNGKIKAIITSLPDMEEVGLDVDLWRSWMSRMCLRLMKSLDDDGVIVFYQTDRKYKGSIIDKKTLISSAFEYNGYKTILSKIVLKQDPNTVNLFRPGFTNLFAFSKNTTSGKATPDVIHCGKMLYKNAMGYNACSLAVDFIATKVQTDVIVDPFCGQGSVLKISNSKGFDAIGVEILEEQCVKAREL